MWEIEPIAAPFFICPQPFFGVKRPRQLGKASLRFIFSWQCKQHITIVTTFHILHSSLLYLKQMTSHQRWKTFSRGQCLGLVRRYA
jgi:hypothetical protein